jgi:transcriptional regulator with XRE-family HTH domain
MPFSMQAPKQPVSELLRDWRERRHMSQLALALEASVSTKHLSFLESGRALPSREMVLTIAKALSVPLRAQNAMLIAAGYAPVFPERALDAPELAGARRAIDAFLSAHEPYPALALDRHWNLVLSNRAVAPLLAGVAPRLLEPPVNVLRVSLHPEGLASRIINLPEWRAHLEHRLSEQIEASADPYLISLRDELFEGERPKGAGSDLVATLRLESGNQVLTLLSATTVFGSPVDVTLSELALELFLPADAATAEALRSTEVLS